jgi:putative ABC transport system permease protein
LDTLWLAALAQRASVLITSPTSRLLLDVAGVPDPVNTLPTSSDDPLLVENGMALPADEPGIVLSRRLAERTGKAAGDRLEIVLRRTIGTPEEVPIPFVVAGVLPLSAGTGMTLWLPHALFDEIHRWRGGQPAPALGLPGKGAFLPPEYDGVLTLLERVPDDADYRRILAGRIGFSRPPEPMDTVGWKVAQGLSVRVWRPLNSPVLPDDIGPLVGRHLALGYRATAVPVVTDFDVRLRLGEETRTLAVAVAPPSFAHHPQVEPAPREPVVWIATHPGIAHSDAGPTDDRPVAALSFAAGSGNEPVVVPVRVQHSDQVLPGHVVVHRELAGRMNAARKRGGRYIADAGEFAPLAEPPRYFRAYAGSIDDLEALVDLVRAQGRERGSPALSRPHSRVAEVQDIRRLSGYMEQLYLLILLVAGVSGFFAVAASVYASVERKRRDLAYLTLLGVHPLALFALPCLKGLVLVLGGVGLALVAYGVFGHFADRAFADALGEAASLTRLAPMHAAALVGGILVTAFLASALAAGAVTRIDAAEYIRE